tara:strand:+ start:161 stop:307 length:147 start_codon:yes stop_codon:yes gene_type:complete
MKDGDFEDQVCSKCMLNDVSGAMAPADYDIEEEYGLLTNGITEFDDDY